MKVGYTLMIHECAIILEVPDVIHMKDFFGVKDVEFITGFRKVFRKVFTIADVLEVIIHIIEFRECLLVADVKRIR